MWLNVLTGLEAIQRTLPTRSDATLTDGRTVSQNGLPCVCLSFSLVFKAPLKHSLSSVITQFCSLVPISGRKDSRLTVMRCALTPACLCFIGMLWRTLKKIENEPGAKCRKIPGSVAAAQKSCRDWIKQSIVFIVDSFYCFVIGFDLRGTATSPKVSVPDISSTTPPTPQ